MYKYVKGLVSVIIPTYRRADKLTRAIESVLSQTYKFVELILVNDNAPDDMYTADLIKRVSSYESDSRFILIMQEEHTNGAAARNVGIRKANGEYIAFLDDDDWWKAEKLEKQIHVIEKLPQDWGGVSCKIERYNGERLVAKLPEYRSGYVYKDILMLVSDFATGTLLLKHEALDSAGYFDEHLFRQQDLQLLVNFTYRYKLMQVNEYLHCCDVSDTQNRPNVDNIVKAKEAFLKSVARVIDSLTPSEKRQVMLLNQAEIGYVQLKNREYIKGVISLLGLVTSLKAFTYECIKLRNFIRSRNIGKQFSITLCLRKNGD